MIEPTQTPVISAELEKDFVDLINGWRTFGAEEDPENFEPYISFDRQHDFTQHFMPAFRKLCERKIAHAVSEEALKIRVQIRDAEVVTKQRYMSDSGFWVSRELIDKNKLLSLLSERKENTNV